MNDVSHYSRPIVYNGTDESIIDALEENIYILLQSAVDTEGRRIILDDNHFIRLLKRNLRKMPHFNDLFNK